MFFIHAVKYLECNSTPLSHLIFMVL